MSTITWDQRGELILSQLMPQNLHRLLGHAIQSYEVVGQGDQCGGDHGGLCSTEKILIAVSASLSQSFQGMTRWSISDTTAGLLKLYKRHTVDRAMDKIIGAEVASKFEIQEMLEWWRWSLAAYDKDTSAFAATVQIEERDVVKLVVKSAIYKPAFFIAVYHHRRCVVMGIRGTQEASDILTDLNPHNKPFQEGAAHAGMLVAAKWLLDKEHDMLKQLLAANQGYKLVLTGHSMGGGIAALLTMLIRATRVGSFLHTTTLGIRASKIFCWGYGCAPCVDRTLAESSNFICNVVLQDDVVPRVSPVAIEALRREIQQTGWKQGLKDGGKKKKVVNTIEQYNVIKNGSKVGASVFQKYQETSITYESGSSGNTGANQLMDTMDMEQDGQKTEAGIAAQAIVAVATGSSTNMHELEKRRLFVPGLLYHIRRSKINKEDLAPVASVPVRPYQVGGEPPRNPKFKHVVIRQTETSSRFGRIVLSGTMFSDHLLQKYNEGLWDAYRDCKN